MSDDSKDIHVRLCELLDRRGVVYRIVTHEPEGRTEYIARIRGNRPEQAIKSIVVQVRFGKKESRYYLANVPGHCRVDLAAIESLLNGTDASIAPRSMAELLTGCVIGAIPPFLFDDRLVLLADPLIRATEEVVFNAGRLDRSICMKSADYFLIAAPQLANIASRA